MKKGRSQDGQDRADGMSIEGKMQKRGRCKEEEERPGDGDDDEDDGGERERGRGD